MSEVAARGSRLAAYVELGKLRLSSLAVFPVLAGLLLGSDELLPLLDSVLILLGTILVAVGGNALNMWLERDTDPHMDRTQSRPIPTGRLGPGEVLGFGLGAGLLGLVLLVVTTNLLATGLCAAIFITYVGVYTPMKRRSTLNTLVGAVPGALPPLVGYAAASGRVDSQGMVLFGILFFWQIPHFLAIAWRYRDQYRAAGLQMLPVVDEEGRSTGNQMLVYAACLFVVSLMPSWPNPGLGGPLYLMVAVAAGLVFVGVTAIAAFKQTAGTMRACFLMSIIYLPFLLSVLVLDKLLLRF